MNPMPLFIDTHKGTQLPADVRRLVEERVRSGKKDDFGVIDRGVLIDHDAGEMHCVLEAPDVSSVLEHHTMVGVPVEQDTVHRADAIMR